MFFSSYLNAENEEKERLQGSYENHHKEKDMSRNEKHKDKTESDAVVAVYDLQAVMQIPKGDISVFYYKSKLNVLNFTIYNAKTNSCNCYVWNETNGQRGVNEIGTCVLDYIKTLCEAGKTDIIFYLDNCSGQQKNKFMMALYLYAVNNLPNITSITHKFLIKGHTQNEGDSAHSLIEREVKRILKSGPIYVPETYITAIRTARKKGQPFVVKELCYKDFLNIKSLATEMGPINCKTLQLSDVKVMKFEKQSPLSVFCKHSYGSDYKELKILKNSNKATSINDLLPCYSSKLTLPANKKKDLMDLCNKNLIPRCHHKFYEDL